MKVWKKKLVTVLFGLAGVLFLVPLVIQLIKAEPLDGIAVTGLCVAAACNIVLLGLLVGGNSTAGPAA